LPSFADAKTRPVDWLVEDLFPRKTVTFITAPTGTGKSIIGLHLALTILTGRPWMNLPCKQGPVAYWDQDNPDHELTENRLLAIANGMSLAEIPRIPESILFRTKHRINEARDKLLAELKEMEAIALFVDTFAAVNPFNENDNTLMSQIMVDCFFPFVEAGITPIVFHHPAKEILLATPKQLKAYQRQGPNAARGATGIPAACGTVFNLVLDEEKHVTLVNAKPRYGNPRTITFLYDESGEMGKDDWRITLRPARPQASVESAISFVNGLIPQVRDAMSSRKLVESMFEEGYYMSQTTAARALRMVAESAIKH